MQYFIIAFFGGFVLPFQAGFNTTLSRAAGSPFFAAAVSFAVGTISMVTVCILTKTKLPPGPNLAALPFWGWLGGCMGAYYVTSAVISAPQIGATSLAALLVSGQMVASLVLDHYGLIGFEVHPINPLRILGAFLLVSGVFLICRN